MGLFINVVKKKANCQIESINVPMTKEFLFDYHQYVAVSKFFVSSPMNFDKPKIQTSFIYFEKLSSVSIL